MTKKMVLSDSDILASIACSYLLLVKEEVTSDIEVVRYLWPVLRSSPEPPRSAGSRTTRECRLPS